MRLLPFCTKLHERSVLFPVYNEKKLVSISRKRMLAEVEKDCRPDASSVHELSEFLHVRSALCCGRPSHHCTSAIFARGLPGHAEGLAGSLQ